MGCMFANAIFLSAILYKYIQARSAVHSSPLQGRAIDASQDPELPSPYGKSTGGSDEGVANETLQCSEGQKNEAGLVFRFGIYFVIFWYVFVCPLKDDAHCSY